LRNSNYRSICIEGGDQIGKGDVTGYLFRKLSEENIKVCKLSFPMYATPFGTIVRKTLEDGFPKTLDIGKAEETKRGIEVKMMLFALNRLEALESILRNFKRKEAYFLLDRSPYSHAVTISYGLGGLKCIRNREVDDLVRLMFKSEQLFLEKLGLSECVIHLVADHGKKGWEKERSDGDLYEVKEVQKVVDDVYAKIGEIVGSGWNRIYTKKQGVFRERRDIYKEVDEVVGTLSLEGPTDSESEIYDVLQVVKDIYGVDVSTLEIYKRYFENIRIDDNERNKETYQLACQIGKYVAKNCPYVEIKDAEVKNNIKEIVESYPEVFSLVGYYLGEKFLSEFKKVLDE
jgi:thymidylate kinase